MQRTQERIDGMAQYRITRRRAELERKEKDKKELSSVLDSLAAFTDGMKIRLFNYIIVQVKQLQVVKTFC